jgi:hypothetical protein
MIIPYILILSSKKFQKTSEKMAYNVSTVGCHGKWELHGAEAHQRKPISCIELV